MTTTLIQVRRGSAATWTSTNPVLSDGEFGLEDNTGKIKIGDGTHAWSSLNYIGEQGPWRFPETYGAGYGGAASDDWGPAIKQAIVDATSVSGFVLLTANYGTRTTVSWPVGSAVPLVFASSAAAIQKLADVVVVDISGPSVTQQADNRWLIGPGYIDGGNNTAWTQPLLRMWFTGDCGTRDMRFSNNYGMAIDMGKQTWDPVHKNVQVGSCGGTDGVTPAIKCASVSGDGGNSTNSVIMDNPRIEAWRTGAFWAIGADAADQLFEVKITGSAKIEISGTTPIYGPAIKLSHVTRYMQQGVRITTDSNGAPGTGQTTPFDAFMAIDNCKSVQLGSIYGDLGGLTSATQVASLIHFNGGNREISYDRLDLIPGSGSTTNKPACVFLWSGTNEMVDRGVYACDNDFMSIPIDSGAPTNFARRNKGNYSVTPGAVTSVSIPHGIGDFSTNPNPGATGTSSFLTPLIPSWATVRAAGTNGANAAAAPNFYITKSNSSITLNFVSALTAATAYSWDWAAEV